MSEAVIELAQTVYHTRMDPPCMAVLLKMLDWIGSDRIGLDWIGLDWIGSLLQHCAVHVWLWPTLHTTHP
jgi:hypothetical protein